MRPAAGVRRCHMRERRSGAVEGYGALARAARGSALLGDIMIEFIVGAVFLVGTAEAIATRHHQRVRPAPPDFWSKQRGTR